MEHLAEIVESILFVAGGAVDVSEITSKLGCTKKEIDKACGELEKKYGNGSGISFLRFGTKLQLSTNSDYAEAVASVMNPIREKQLSRATLETLSIIAYKQPTTRLEIEDIRGVSSDYAINLLLEHKLIEIVGRRETVGRPVEFGTTDEFLKRFDLHSLDDLPDYNELVERIAQTREKENEKLYREFEVPDEEIVPEISREDKEEEQRKSLEIEEQVKRAAKLIRQTESKLHEHEIGSDEVLGGEDVGLADGDAL